jgi:glycosyltransferase involved in cell wall biosynthesis
MSYHGLDPWLMCPNGTVVVQFRSSKMASSQPRVLILGTRGIPAAHGGFETFAERLSLFLVGRGWRVTVYCQNDVARVSRRFATDMWHGIERVAIEVARSGARATIAFDWHSVRHAASQDGVCLVLGYNTSMFLALLRLRNKKILTNMDGIEWQRPKWSRPVRAWFYLHEWLGAWLSHRLVADHPAIADHLATRRRRRAIVTIPYGGDEVRSAPAGPVEALGLVPRNYLVSIARIEPDNNILLMVRAFSRQARGARLVVLGTLDDRRPYHHAVRAAASPEVMFPGAIYDRQTVEALRFHARAYCHGHTVGGTNPSLVESLWCGNAVLAHLNRFNLWTAGPDQFFFADENECDSMIARILADDTAVARARSAARARAAEFDWTSVLRRYENELATVGDFATARPADQADDIAAGAIHRP